MFPSQTANSIIPFSSEIASAFTVNTPTGVAACDAIEGYKVYSDAAKTTPFVSDSQATLTDALVLASAQLSIVCTSAINFKTFYIEGFNALVPG